MPGIWQRHPRYTISVLLLLTGTFYLLSPYSSAPGFGSGSSVVSQWDRSIPWEKGELAGRIAVADKIYEETLEQRKGLIHKFGPDPKEIHTFPPDKDPWPPYTVWDFFPATYNCPHEIERHGALGDGGKWVCGLSRLREKRNCVVYSFGINYESSFEAEILKHTKHCQIWGYDFSVKSFGPEIPSHLKSRTHFHAFGLAGKDDHGPGKSPAMYTLESLMKMNGHTHIDILKVDIEGYEFEALSSFMEPYLEAGTPLPVGQLELEIHLWEYSFVDFLKWWENLEQVGLRPFWTEPNLVYQNYNRGSSAALAEYSYINVKDDNVFVRDPQKPASD